MKRNKLVVLIQFLDAVHRCYAGGCHVFILHPWVESRHLHSKTLSYACHVAAHLPECVNAQRLALKLAACFAVVAVANHQHSHAKHQLGNGVGILSGCIHHTHAVSSGFGEVNVVVTCTGTHHHLEQRCCIKHFFINNVAAHNQTGCIGNLGYKVGFSAFFQQHQFVACFFHHLAYAVDSSCGKWFFGSN